MTKPGSIMLAVVTAGMVLAQAAPLPNSASAGAQFGGTDAKAGKHPRLFFSSDDLPALRQKATTSACFTQLVAFVEATPFVEKDVGDRGYESNPAMVAEAFLALVTQEPRYIEKAKKQLLQTASWDISVWRGIGWHGGGVAAGLGLGHFSRAAGISYDWLYPFLTDDERRIVREALAGKAFAAYRQGVDLGPRSEYWLATDNNWCPVIHGGVGIAALATLGEIPEAAWVLGETRRRIRKYIDPLPDGGCMEGVAYDIYGASNDALFGAALQHVIGTDDGILDRPGMKNLGLFLSAFTGADGYWVNFSDCQTNIDLCSDLYPLVWHYRDKVLDAYLQHYVGRWRRGGGAPWEIIFRPTDMDAIAAPHREALRVFSDTHWAAMQSDTMQLFFKSGNFGSRYTGHKHDDLNSFVLILNGERLVPEAPGNNRETCYHSTILVNGKGQTRNSTGTIVQSGYTNSTLFVTAQANSAYGSNLTCFLRTAFLAPDRFVAIGDVLKGPVGNQYEWKLQTSKTPDLSPDQKSGRITGKKSALQVQVVVPGNATLSIGKSCGPCLSANVTAAESSATYFVVLAPADRPVSAKAIGNDVQVTTAEGVYTFRVTDNGWEAVGNTRAREARHEGNGSI